MNRKLWMPLLALLIAVLLQFVNERSGAPQETGGALPDKPATTSAADNGALLAAIAARAEDVQVEGGGIVAKVLPDDNQGSRHQRFIVSLETGDTVLIAHNIDLAPRVEPLKAGDSVTFFGEYVWNPQGGVVHWTHHDPQGRHPDGWIRRAGKIFE